VSAAEGIIRIEIDGGPPTTDALQRLALDHSGHFTAMQVRDARVRGLDLHLARLDEGSRELFGAGLDGERVRALARHALGGDVRDASLRVIVFEPGARGELAVMVTLRPPGGVSRAPQALHAVEYQRTLAHVKHIGGFGQGHHARMARRAGFDDALFNDPNGGVSETSIANVGFLCGGEVVWPNAPALQGITMQLVEPRLDGVGIPTRRRPVRLADLPSCSAAFVTNARGIAPVGRIDDVSLGVDHDLLAALDGVYAEVPWDAF
jgi:branched-subunit amino acid aminotransferase/4-amino-4-deoxychorismate lyase